MNAIRRVFVIQETLTGKRTIDDAAAALGLSERQVKRLKKGVKEHKPRFSGTWEPR